MITKLANAFVPDAEMSSGARRAFVFGGTSAVDWLQRRMGGLWVGGRVTLTEDHVYFTPNGLNAMAHAADTTQLAPLDRVVEVRDRFGILTRIVDVKLDDGSVFTFRCFGAGKFARQIMDAVARKRGRGRQATR
jgi:hypothetical protein